MRGQSTHFETDRYSLHITLLVGRTELQMRERVAPRLRRQRAAANRVAIHRLRQQIRALRAQQRRLLECGPAPVKGG